jgi:Mn2+/Fe2+ NRAMP family transporter
MHPDWSQLARGVLPHLVQRDAHHLLLYWYFAVGIFSAMLMEYEVHFYSSGAIEEKWTVKDLGENFMVASIGSVLGSLLTVALLVLGAVVFLPRRIFPEPLSSTIFAGALPFAQKALVLALFGALACIAGAAVETALSGAYNICQFFNLPWGKDLSPGSAPVYTASWLGMFAFALVIALTGVRPLQLVNISVVFSMVVMPLTYYPILRVARTRKSWASMSIPASTLSSAPPSWC